MLLLFGTNEIRKFFCTKFKTVLLFIRYVSYASAEICHFMKR